MFAVLRALQGIFIFMWAQYRPLTYNRTYQYPQWAIGLGLFMAIASMICIPLYFIVKLACASGTLRMVRIHLCKPTIFESGAQNICAKHREITAIEE
jgi:hypothetical protein